MPRTEPQLPPDPAARRRTPPIPSALARGALAALTLATLAACGDPSGPASTSAPEAPRLSLASPLPPGFSTAAIVAPRLIPGNLSGNANSVCAAQYGPGVLGIKVEGAGNLNQAGIQVTITNGTFLAFSATGALVRGVLIKGGPNTNAYDYNPPATSDVGLRAPLNPGGNIPQISHYIVCYVKAAVKKGTKYLDQDRDGYRDAGEPGLAGVTIRIYRDNGDGVLTAADALTGSVVTGATGSYQFTVAPGTYFVCEVATATHVQTAPTNNTFCAGIAGLERGGWKVVLTSGQIDSGNDFGNAERPKHGYLKICKLIAGPYAIPLPTFEFTVSGSPTTYYLTPAAAGQPVCTAPITVAVGEYTVTEKARTSPAQYFVAAIDVTPAGALLAKSPTPGANNAGGWARVLVGPSTTVTVTFTNTDP